MGIFNFDWLMSDERKRLRTLQIAEQEMKNELLSKKLVEKAQEVANIQPYRKIIYNNGALTVILKDGNVLTRKGADQFLFTQVQNAYSEDVIKGLMAPAPLAVAKEDYTPEEIKLVEGNIGVLANHPDFEMVGSDVFLRGVKLALPPIVLASFIEIIERQQLFNALDIDDDLNTQYTALKMFWLKLSTSPRAESREQVLRFCRKNDIRLSKTGNIIGYRRVIPWNKEKKLNDFVEKEYNKIKTWKKNPSNYTVYQDKLRYFSALDNKDWPAIGNLAELKADNCEYKELFYTSQHNSGKYVFQIGDIYKSEDGDIDLRADVCHSGGLHFAACSYDYSGYGSVPVVVLINPARTTTIPTSEIRKGRTVEMKIACINPNGQGVHIDEKLIEQADEEYNEFTIIELELAAASKDFTSLCVMDEVPTINLVDLATISEALRNRVVNI